LHNHCFLPKREAQKLAFAHFNNLKQNFRWRPQFTDQRQKMSHLLTTPFPFTLTPLEKTTPALPGAKCIATDHRAWGFPAKKIF
jgi:hypothetical protein